MDKEFSWNLPDIYDARKANRALQVQNALAGALAGALQAGQDRMAEQAQMARWMELENKFANRTMNPRMKMAAMLAMAGQPGLLQQMFTSGGTGEKEAQGEMDNLESSMANDMFALAGADSDTYDKLTGALIPLYRSKYEDLLKKGAKSRMGNSWDEGWGLHLSRGKAERQRRKNNREQDRKNTRAMLPE